MSEVINTGLIEGQRPTDYIAGVSSPLGYTVNNPSGDWQPFVPLAENQWSNRGDSMSCVTFSALNVIETQERFLTGSAPNYSDRWIAKMSNTTKEGNYLWAVADAIRKYGLVPESMYPSPLSYTWEEYHAEIPPAKMAECLAEGKRWLEKWSISYEWVTVSKANLEYHLKQAPLQATIPGHAIEQIYQADDYWKYFDTYNPYVKQRDGLPIYVLKIILNPLNKEPMQLKRDKGTVYLVGNKGKLGISNPETLAMLNKISDEMVDGDTSNVPDLGVIDQGLIIDFKEGV